MNERELEVVIRAVDWVLADQSDLEFAGFTALDRAHAYSARDTLVA